jgi:hypothetical protein
MKQGQSNISLWAPRKKLLWVGSATSCYKTYTSFSSPYSSSNCGIDEVLKHIKVNGPLTLPSGNKKLYFFFNLRKKLRHTSWRITIKAHVDLHWYTVYHFCSMQLLIMITNIYLTLKQRISLHDTVYIGIFPASRIGDGISLAQPTVFLSPKYALHEQLQISFSI